MTPGTRLALLLLIAAVLCSIALAGLVLGVVLGSAETWRT